MCLLSLCLYTFFTFSAEQDYLCPRDKKQQERFLKYSEEADQAFLNEQRDLRTPAELQDLEWELQEARLLRLASLKIAQEANDIYNLGTVAKAALEKEDQTNTLATAQAVQQRGLQRDFPEAFHVVVRPPALPAIRPQPGNTRRCRK